jgi:hypothetical protein
MKCDYDNGRSSNTTHKGANDGLRELTCHSISGDQREWCDSE